MNKEVTQNDLDPDIEQLQLIFGGMLLSLTARIVELQYSRMCRFE